MPVRDILVGDTGCDIKHDDATLPVDVVAIAKAAKLLLTSGVPDVELNLAQVLLPSLDFAGNTSEHLMIYRCEAQRMNLDAQGRDVLLLELASQMSLDEGGLDLSLVCGYRYLISDIYSDLSGTSITDEHQLECWNLLAFCSHVVDSDR